MLRDSVYVNGLTPIFGANGFGVPDPAVQTFLSYGGYFDGQTINSNLLLPGDLLYPERVWERQSDTNNTFTPMHQPQFGLPSRPQFPTLCDWEWREDKIWMVGSTQVRDLRLRYYAALPQFFSPTLDFASTFVPVLDSLDAIAYKGAVLYARMLGSPGLPDLIAEAKEQTFQLKNQYTRRAQSVDYHRVPYGHSGGDMNNFFLSWGNN